MHFMKTNVFVAIAYIWLMLMNNAGWSQTLQIRQDLWRDPDIYKKPPNPFKVSIVEAIRETGEQSIPMLLDFLKNPELNEIALIGLKDDKATLVLLETFCTHEDSDYRIMIGRALQSNAESKSLSPKMAEVVSQRLIQNFSEQNPEIKCLIIYILSEIGTQENIIAHLCHTLSDRAPKVRRATVDALSEMREKVHRAVPKLIERLDDEDSMVRASAIYTLYRVDGATEQLILKCIEKLSDEETMVRTAAAYVLEKAGNKASNAIPELLKKLYDKNENGEVKDCSVRAILEIDRKQLCEKHELISELIKDEETRTGGLAILAKMEIIPNSYWPVLLELFEHDNFGILKKEIATLFGNMQEPNLSAISMLLNDLANPTTSLSSYHITETLGKIGQKAPDEVVRAILNASFPENNNNVLQMSEVEKQEYREDYYEHKLLAIGFIGKKARLALNFVRTALLDKNATIRERAVQTLGKMEATASSVVPDVLNVLCNDKEICCRMEAARTLGKITPQNISSDAPVIHALIKTLSEDRSDLKICSIEALEKIGVYSDNVISGLIHMLSDKNPLVKKAAMAVFPKIGAKALPLLKETVIKVK